MLSPNISRDLTVCSEFGKSCPESFSSAGVRGVTFLFILTILGNLAIIVSISYFKLHSLTNFIILSMAITDFLLDFAITPYSMVRPVENCWGFGMTFCKVHYGFDLMLCLASTFHLCSIAVDRFYAICHPLHYTSTMTVVAIKQIIAVCWSVPAALAFGVVFSEAYASGIEGYEMMVKCLSLCPIVFNKLGTVLFTVGFFVPVCILIGIYVKMFTVSQRHTCELSQTHRNVKKNELSKNKDRKADKTLGIVMLGFLICWSCFFTILIDPFLNLSIPLLLFDALNWLGYLNSFCNPLIYGDPSSRETMSQTTGYKKYNTRLESYCRSFLSVFTMFPASSICNCTQLFCRVSFNPLLVTQEGVKLMLGV
ncbi:LOW QUALITY PROTEIN: trace amine-associated receptor 2-like [Leptosomus discolor]